MVAGLFDRGILAVGLTYPVVPKGDETIRFQINAAHTESDIDELLGALKALRAVDGRHGTLAQGSSARKISGMRSAFWP